MPRLSHFPPSFLRSIFVDVSHDLVVAKGPGRRDIADNIQVGNVPTGRVGVGVPKLDGPLAGWVPRLLAPLRLAGLLDPDVPAEVGPGHGEVDEELVLERELKYARHNELVFTVLQTER